MSETPHLLLEHYLEAVNAADPEALLALYTGDARVFDAGLPAEGASPAEHWMLEGSQAWRPMVENWLQMMRPGGHSRAVDVRIDESGDLAMISALVWYAGELTSGHPAELWNRYTAVGRKVEGRWLIAHEHTSLPVNMESMQAITTR